MTVYPPTVQPSTMHASMHPTIHYATADNVSADIALAVLTA